MATEPANALTLADYRRRVAESYAAARRATDPEEGWKAWRAERDALFATHPQSPIEDRSSFAGLPYFPYQPHFRVTGVVHADEPARLAIPHSSGGSTVFVRIGRVVFTIAGVANRLDLYWLDAYGGGLFLPFRDVSNGDTTYGGGRYLLDTVKGADLGSRDGRLIFDFNFAYHPSCVYSSRWSCPLAPPGNTLDVGVAAGERLTPDRTAAPTRR
jgi:uncharacterized protein (DUF1684 family)